MTAMPPVPINASKYSNLPGDPASRNHERGRGCPYARPLFTTFGGSSGPAHWPLEELIDGHMVASRSLALKVVSLCSPMVPFEPVELAVGFFFGWW
jgi:hypothetical protein